jgi:hypothetical protein
MVFRFLCLKDWYQATCRVMRCLPLTRNLQNNTITGHALATYVIGPVELPLQVVTAQFRTQKTQFWHYDILSQLTGIQEGISGHGKQTYSLNSFQRPEWFSTGVYNFPPIKKPPQNSRRYCTQFSCHRGLAPGIYAPPRTVDTITRLWGPF